jgi:hypothetical protein
LGSPRSSPNRDRALAVASFRADLMISDDDAEVTLRRLLALAIWLDRGAARRAYQPHRRRDPSGSRTAPRQKPTGVSR